VDFWYDFSSPFAYLASTQIAGFERRTGAAVTWRPMLLGAVFREVGTADVPMLSVPAQKRAYFHRELSLWSSVHSVPFRFASRFPMRTVTPLRLALLAGDRVADLSRVLFNMAWVEDRDITETDTLTAALAEVGLSPTLIDDAGSPRAKRLLFSNTQEAIDAKVFGAPTFAVHQSAEISVYWGQDRIPLLEEALRSQPQGESVPSQGALDG
jgi:2-hydroxychromene-2-carboxylate isomerase